MQIFLQTFFNVCKMFYTSQLYSAKSVILGSYLKSIYGRIELTDLVTAGIFGPIEG